MARKSPKPSKKSELQKAVVLPAYIRTKHPKLDDPDDIERRIEEYFLWCEEHYELCAVPFFIGKKIQPQYKPRASLKKEQPPTLSGLAEFLDTERTTIWRISHANTVPESEMPKWLARMDKEQRDAICNAIKKATERVQHWWERKLNTPGAAAGVIFNLVNNFKNWQDVKVFMSSQEAQLRAEVETLRAQVAAPFHAAREGRKIDAPIKRKERTGA